MRSTARVLAASVLILLIFRFAVCTQGAGKLPAGGRALSRLRRFTSRWQR